MGVAVGDYDNDGYEDLYVTAYGGNRLYHNNGNGTFTDVTAQSGTGGSGWSTSAAWVDLDNDGLLDLVVLRYVQWDFDDIYCGEHQAGHRAYCHPDVFQPISALVYHNDGNGHFTEEAAKAGLNKPGKGLGIALADFDRDGKTDIVVANDSMLEFLYRNKGDGTFEEDGLNAEIAVDGDGRTYAGMGIDFQDYNNDGLPDLVITDSGQPEIRSLQKQRRWQLYLRQLHERHRRHDLAALRLGNSLPRLRQRRAEGPAHRSGPRPRYHSAQLPAASL